MLQADWSMRRLRPNSVSNGCTATQFDAVPQSPQPSQTSSLMMTRASGIRIFPALAQTALFGGAGLIVDENRDAFRLRQVALDLVENIAMVDDQPRRPRRQRRIFAAARP